MTRFYGLVLVLVAAAATGDGQPNFQVRTGNDRYLEARVYTYVKPCLDRQLQTQLSQIASAAKGKVGVAAVVLETGDTVSLNPRDHFPMQSVYKLPIGMAVMQQVDGGKVKLDQIVRVTKEYYVGKDSYNPLRDKYPDGGELSVRE